MTQTQVDKRCGRRFKEARCETMENESIGQRGMGISYKGSQGQTERVVALQEGEQEEEEEEEEEGGGGGGEEEEGGGELEEGEGDEEV